MFIVRISIDDYERPTTENPRVYHWVVCKGYVLDLNHEENEGGIKSYNILLKIIDPENVRYETNYIEDKNGN